MRNVILTLLLLPISLFSQGRGDSALYRVRWKADGALILAGGLGSLAGFVGQSNRHDLLESDVLALKESDVPAFDRYSLHVSLDKRQSVLRQSDITLYASLSAPFLLIIDKRVRKEWRSVLALYIETALLTNAIQTNSAVLTDRYRPIAYIPEATMGERTARVNHFSFFSGHSSSSAMACFFTARILDDMHPEMGKKRWILYTAAAVPSFVTGLNRIQGAKHFPSDVLMGFAVGTTMGILVPKWHLTHPTSHTTVLPYPTRDGGLGLALRYQW